MTENIQTLPQSQPVTEIVPDQLTLQMRRLRRENPRLELNQQRIAKELNRDQSAISKAMSHPEVYPGLALRIQKYLNRIESSRNKLTQKETASA